MGLNLKIGFSRSNSITSKIFRWFLKSPISHSFIIVTLNDKVEFTIGADDRGLHWQSLNLFSRNSEIIALYKPVGNNIENSFWKIVDEYGNTSYDYLAAGAIGFRNRLKCIWKLIGKLWKKSLDSKKLTCMELITRMLNYAGYELTKNEDPEMFDPHQLMMKMSNSNEFTPIQLTGSNYNYDEINFG